MSEFKNCEQAVWLVTGAQNVGCSRPLALQVPNLDTAQECERIIGY